jgi:hypothetical protein
MRLSEHVPERYAELNSFDNTGDSYIIDPRGEVIAGPAKGESILIAEGSMEAVMAAKVATDIGGHYSRPDQLQLHVDGRPLRRIVENEAAVGEAGMPLTGSEQQADDDPNDQRKTRLTLAG